MSVRMFPELAYESKDGVKRIAFSKAGIIIQLTKDLNRTKRSRKGGFEWREREEGKRMWQYFLSECWAGIMTFLPGALLVLRIYTISSLALRYDIISPSFSSAQEIPLHCPTLIWKEQHHVSYTIWWPQSKADSQEATDLETDGFLITS